MVNVMQIRIRIYLLNDIPASKMLAETAAFLDKQLVQDKEFAKLHSMNQFKNYCYDSLYPVEPDKIYHKDKIYTLTIRTIDRALACFFEKRAVNGYTETMKALTAEVRLIPRKQIDLIWSLTPVILKCENGYWRDSLSIEQYEERLKINLLKKWKQFYGEKLEEDFELFIGIEFLNKMPIAVEYKGIRLLGDKPRLHIAENETAQELAQMAVGGGLGEMNARGMGFCSYRWL